MQKNDTGEFVRILELYNPMEAHFVVGLLESHGLQSPLNHVGNNRLDFVSEQRIPIFVQKDKVEIARQLLEETRNSVEPDPEWEAEMRGEREKFETYRKTIWLLFFIIFSYTAITSPSSSDQEIFQKIFLWIGALSSLGIYIFSKDERRKPRR